MKAVCYDSYGGMEVIEIREIEKPTAAEGQVLVRVQAAAINPYELHFLHGLPKFMRLFSGLRRPKNPRLGSDFAGTVEEVGPGVSGFKVGDEVYGCVHGALAEYHKAPIKAIAHKPTNLDFSEAASLPMVALTALQGLRDNGRLQPGQTVLVNGASGGVGTAAVQIAKAMGAEVTGVCSGRNAELVRSLGADRVIDYTQEDFIADGAKYDVFYDNIGNRTVSECYSILKDTGRYVGAGADSDKKGYINRMWKMALKSLFGRRKMISVMAKTKGEDLAIFKEMVESGKIKPVIDREYPLSDIVEALTYLETGRVRGKVVIKV